MESGDTPGHISQERIPPGICDEQITIVNTHAGGHGYEALLALIQMDHPIYHLHPTLFIRAPLRQRKTEALSAYIYRYTDYLRLRAFTSRTLTQILMRHRN